jgi:hypothetical protein
MDLQERTNRDSFLSEYDALIKNLEKNKNKFTFVKATFDIDLPELDNIINKMGYLNGSLEIKEYNR